MFCGGLNDEPEAATTQVVAGPAGSVIELDTDASAASGGPVLRPGSGFTRADAFDGFRTWNLAPLLPADQAFTRVFMGEGELIDHIFASHRLVNPSNLPTITTLQSGDALPSVNEDPGNRRNKPGSDHAAVVATFTLT